MPAVAERHTANPAVAIEQQILGGTLGDVQIGCFRQQLRYPGDWS